MSIEQDFCQGWQFREGFAPEWTKAPLGAAGQAVDLPHTAVELPLTYFDERSYQRDFTYQKRIDWQVDFDGKEVSLIFDGAMANAQVYLDGEHLGGHRDGYTPFEIRLTDRIKPGGSLLSVHIDGRENPDIPPFGGQIDYLTYAGIYREVWLRVSDPIALKRAKIETPDVLAAEKTVTARVWLSNPQNLPVAGTLTATLCDGQGQELAQTVVPLDGMVCELRLDGLEDIALWSPDTPALYQLRLTLDAGKSCDSLVQSFGFRHAEFTPAGFFLNDERVKLIGLNRHQSFPYSGYAQGRASQERDAEILKQDLACNIVRTSHYPQSKWFLDHCDRIGLMVLEEIPGWQHIGGQVWQDEAVENTRRMITRDWNHPSIILWGVRINESPDDEQFYKRTNDMARELDTTRQTGGIRKDRGSTLLEDVYTYNDFVLGEHEMPGANRPRIPLQDPQDVTGLNRPVPYLVSEYNGHMFPTKVTDQEERQMEHVTRHLDVLNAAFGDDGIAGCIGWCMFDYNTHKDFGSGDRICHHGVMSIFREPKFAAYAYASQGNPNRRVVMKPITHWARGERSIGGTLPLMILTNCDLVQLRFEDGHVVELHPDRDRYPHLPHPPMILHQKDAHGSGLGDWGMAWRDVEVIGYLNGAEAARMRLLADPVATELALVPDAEVGARPSEIRVAVRALDQAGNPLPYLDAPVRFTLDGPAQLIGPDWVTLRGGAAALWIRPTGSDPITLRAECPRLPSVRLTI